jgi:hypothetical protein
MSEAFSQRPIRLRLAYEILFSLYSSVVVMSAEETRGFSWSTTVYHWYALYRDPSVRKPHSPHAERVIAFFLAWLLVILIFLSLRVLARFSFGRLPLQAIAGFVAIGGLPAALLYCGFGNRILVTALIILSVICVLVYVYRKWPASDPVALAILVLYFAFTTLVAWRSWGTFPLGFLVLWPGMDWILGTYRQTQNVYPLLGFVLSVFWGIRVKEGWSGGAPLSR